MARMVKRDRNHPSVLMWSFCNEVECRQESPVTGRMFRNATRREDTSRPTTANSDGWYVHGDDSLITGLDVQGLSHAGEPAFEGFHAAHPHAPLVLSECCSCPSQRLPANQRGSNDTCMREHNQPGLLNITTGSLGVWTLFDYSALHRIKCRLSHLRMKCCLSLTEGVRC